ncbi:MAG: HD-GYP domain-containing protein [Deltaproteobacteria bacterium]|nr:HD-GYP domain-containing protein [Deltaproteobacteria bacterium]
MEHHKLKTIKVKDLKIGMYVITNLSWYEHPFLKNQFLIKSRTDIEKIKALGIKEIQIDQARSEKAAGTGLTEDPPGPEREEKRDARGIIPEALISAIHDDRMHPREKALIVQKQSFIMMKNLFANPSAENIRKAKTGISEIVNLILEDDATLLYLLNITEHDYYTYTHSVDVGILGVALAKSLFKESGNHDIHALGAGFFLHDLGKVYIDKNIINKPGKLTDEEMNEMRRHPTAGFKLLFDTNQLTDESKIIVLQHHERIDGTGYPKKLRGSEIHIYGRICAIADVFDALTTDRPYRQKMNPFDALKLMRDEMIHHFQKDLFERFVLLFIAPVR